MTDTTNLGTIWVVGQRRAPGGTFPSGGSSGGAGDSGGVHQREVDPDPEEPPYSPPDPCADPATALEWNTDAAAAAAAKEFARLAAERTPSETLNTREWGCYLYRAADGSIQRGPITFGDPFSNGGNGTVTLSDVGINPSTIVGSVHSHGSGNHLPSSGNAEFPGDIQHLDGMVSFSGNSSARLYIVAESQGPVGFLPYNQINVYNQTTAQQARDSFTPGPEVNPDGMPCPAT